MEGIQKIFSEWINAYTVKTVNYIQQIWYIFGIIFWNFTLNLSFYQLHVYLVVNHIPFVFMESEGENIKKIKLKENKIIYFTFWVSKSWNSSGSVIAL